MVMPNATATRSSGPMFPVLWLDGEHSRVGRMVLERVAGAQSTSRDCSGDDDPDEEESEWEEGA